MLSSESWLILLIMTGLLLLPTLSVVVVLGGGNRLDSTRGRMDDRRLVRMRLR